MESKSNPALSVVGFILFVVVFAVTFGFIIAEIYAAVTVTANQSGVACLLFLSLFIGAVICFVRE